MPGPSKLGQSIRVDFTHESKSGMQICIDEITPYTCLLSIAAESARPEWLPEIQIKVRIYHDAKMAEVVEWCNDRTIPWELAEKSSMQAPDEKCSTTTTTGTSKVMPKAKKVVIAKPRYLSISVDISAPKGAL